MKDNKNVLVVNTGSTSVKYKLFNYKGEEKFAENFSAKKENDKKKEKAFLSMVKKITRADGVKIVFRVVHGGDMEGVQVIDGELKKKIKKFALFAPIHNKAVLRKITLLQKDFSVAWEVRNFYAVFDTDFHRSIPKERSTYAMDQSLAEKYKLKKYGFHGIAIQSVLSKIKQVSEQKIICAHLGGGSSITAVEDGVSVATTMGLTPLSGLMMTTRVGDVDSDLDKILAQKIEKPLSVVSDMFSRKSGFLGLTGSVDTKDIFDKAKVETENSLGEYVKEKLAFDMYVEQIIEKIGGYYASMGGVDLLIFSGGIGEGNSFLRKTVVARLKHLGLTSENTLAVKVDEEKVLFGMVRGL